MKYVANSNGQDLVKHLAGVARASELILSEVANESFCKEFSRHIIFGGLIHDLGKCSPDFQSYLKKVMKSKNNTETSEDNRGAKDKFNGPYHNEISALMLKSLTRYNDDLISDASYMAFWHHAGNYNYQKGKLHFEGMREAYDAFMDNQLKADSSFSYESFLEEGLTVYREALKIFKESTDTPAESLVELDEVMKMTSEPHRSLRDVTFSKFKSYRVTSHQGVEDIDDTARKTLLLTVMVEADKWISSKTVQELDWFLNDKPHAREEVKRMISNVQGLTDNNLAFKPIPDGTPDHRVTQSQEQFYLAERASKHVVSVCGVDPSGGKTSISVLWWNKLNEEQGKRKVIFILPRQHQTNSLFKGISKEIGRIIDGEVSVQSFHSGSIQYATDPSIIGLEDSTMSDLNIMVFDRLILGLYDRKKISEMFKSLFSHLVIDEFHEFNSIPRMILGLAEIIHIRSNFLKGVNTILLSGTPDLPLLDVCGIKKIKEKGCFFDRSNMSPQKKELTLEMAELPLQDSVVTYSPNSLYTFATIRDAQEFDPMGEYEIAHSRMINEHKNSLVMKILENNGEENFLKEQSPVVSSKLFQSSFDMCFKEIHSELSLPFTDIQTIGRNNRFGKRDDAKFVFYPPKSDRIYNVNAIGGKKVHESWSNHVHEKVLSFQGRKVAYRELITELFDEFMDDAKNYKEWKEEILRKAKAEVDHLQNMIPKRTFSKSKKAVTNNRINDDGLRGGGQYYVTAPIVVDSKLVGWLGGSEEAPLIATAIPKGLANKKGSSSAVILTSNQGEAKDFVEKTLGLEVFNKRVSVYAGKSENAPLILEDFTKTENFENYYDFKKGLILNSDEESTD